MATEKIGLRQYDTRSGRIIQNVMPTLILLDRDLQEGNWFTFYSRVPVMLTRAEAFNWDVDALLAQSDTLSAAVSDGTTTTFPVSNPERWNVGTIWLVKTSGELVRVEAVNTATSNVTVTRGVSALASAGGTAAASIASGGTIVKLSPAVGEDNRRLAAHHTVPTSVSNYSQQMRWEVSASRRQIKRSFEAQEAEWPWLLMKAMLEARREMNATFLVSEKARYTDAVMGDTTVTQGLRPSITTYTYNVNGTLYQANFNDWLVKEGLRKGRADKLLLASNAVILAITEMANEIAHFNMPMGAGSTSFGIQVMGYKAPNGKTLTVVEDRFLSENFDGEAYLVDMGQLKRRVYSNHGLDDDLHIISDTNDPDDLGRNNSIFCDMGFQYGDESGHGKLTNVSGGAKGSAAA